MQPDSSASHTTQRLVTAIRVELARRNIKHAEAARLTGKTRQAFSQRMLGQVPFTVDEVAQLAAVCEIPIADLISEELVGDRVHASSAA